MFGRAAPNQYAILQEEAEPWRWMDEQETTLGMAEFDGALEVAEKEAAAAEAAIVAAAADPVGFRVMRKHMDRLPFTNNG